MRLDLYQAETVLIANQQTALLDEAAERLLAGSSPLSRLEQNGVLHAIQLLVENAVGKAKHLLKAHEKPVPVSAYDCFVGLIELGVVAQQDLPAWNVAIGLRNKIVHDYMNIDMARVLELVRQVHYRFVTAFLLEPIYPGGDT